MAIRIVLRAFALTVGLASCASPATGPSFEAVAVPPDKGVLYVYRPDVHFNRGGYPNVFINGERRFALRERGYAVLLLQAANYEIRLEGSLGGTGWWRPAATRTIGIQPGREYFVRAIPTQSAGVGPGPGLFSESAPRSVMELVPKEQALREIAALRLVGD